MTRFPCKRSWEIEALEDGRLSERDRASLERHLEACPECREAQGKHQALDAALKALPREERTEMDHRRARAALLVRANELGVGGERGRLRWVALVAAPVALAIVVIVALLRRAPSANDGIAHSSAPAPSAVASAPLFEVDAVGRADYSSERESGVSRVNLRAGTASFHVEHVKPGARFLVKVPDGEVEVRGTRFVVDVADGHTRSVVVTEGVVAVRVEGFDGVLRAGERWPASVVPAAATTATATSTATDVPPPSASVAPAPPASHLAPAPSAAARGLAGPRFADAMAAFNAGDYATADRLFVTFVRDFPSDSRAEDAMFLVADARTRRGDAAGAREAARAYLERFPQGLRAPAVRRIASDGSGAPARDE